MKDMGLTRMVTLHHYTLPAWLAEKGFKGDGPIPKVDPAIIDPMAQAYTVPYRMITGQELPPQILFLGQSDIKKIFPK